MKNAISGDKLAHAAQAMMTLGGQVHSALAAAFEAPLTAVDSPRRAHAGPGAMQAETDRRAAEADRELRAAADAERRRADAQRRAAAAVAEDAKRQEQRREEAARQQRCVLCRHSSCGSPPTHAKVRTGRPRHVSLYSSGPSTADVSSA